MSAVIRTHTPFVVEEVLLDALERLGLEPVLVNTQNQSQFRHRETIRNGDIVTNRSDFYGPQYFRLDGGTWNLRHDSSEMNGRIISQLGTKNYKKVGVFLMELGKVYANCFSEYQDKIAEQERERIEAERKALVEKKRQEVIQKAKEQGYAIREERKNGKIQLVLTRSS